MNLSKSLKTMNLLHHLPIYDRRPTLTFIVLLTTILSLITTGFLFILPTDKIAELG